MRNLKNASSRDPCSALRLSVNYSLIMVKVEMDSQKKCSRSPSSLSHIDSITARRMATPANSAGS